MVEKLTVRRDEHETRAREMSIVTPISMRKYLEEIPF
jgi:hypothetical protein